MAAAAAVMASRLSLEDVPLRSHNASCGPQTGQALREGFHRGVRAVIGQRFDDAEARAAVGAVGERVPVTAVGGVEDLAQAVATGRDVRQHQSGLGPAGFAWADFKASVADRIEPEGFEALDRAARRLFHFQAKQECFQISPQAFDLDEHALSGVVDPTFERGGRGKPVYEGAKPDALDRTPHYDSKPRVHSNPVHNPKTT